LTNERVAGIVEIKPILKRREWVYDKARD